MANALMAGFQRILHRVCPRPVGSTPANSDTPAKIRRAGIIRPNSGNHVIMLVKDDDVAVIEMTVGEILGAYAINPNRNYQAKKPLTADQNHN